MSKLLNHPTPTVNDLAKKYGVSVLEVKKQLMKGIKVEKEHTSNTKIAREIALDHLGEKLNYYTLLAKIEENTTGHVRGLGFVSGDPSCGIDYVDQYKGTNMMSYDDDNGDKLKYLQQAHIDHHNKALGFNHFNPTSIGTHSNSSFKANTALREATTTRGGMGGNHSPTEEGDEYLSNNVKGTARDASIRDRHADENHHSLHGKLGFNAFRHKIGRAHV